MRSKQSVFVSILVAAALVVAGLFAPSSGVAQDDKVKTAMELLRSMADKLGPPKIEGLVYTVAGKQVPAIYFGSTKMNNNFSLVDEVAKQAGGTATIFVKNGDEFVRVTTNVKKDDGSRATGTIFLIQKEKRSRLSRRTKPSMEKSIFSANLTLRDMNQYEIQSKGVIGIYYVGYLK